MSDFLDFRSEVKYNTFMENFSTTSRRGGGRYEECIIDGNRKKGFSEWDGTLRETLNR